MNDRVWYLAACPTCDGEWPGRVLPIPFVSEQARAEWVKAHAVNGPGHQARTWEEAR